MVTETRKGNRILRLTAGVSYRNFCLDRNNRRSRYAGPFRRFEEVRPALGGDGDALGDQPDGGADPRAAVRLAAGAERGADRAGAVARAIDRQPEREGV